MRQIRDQAIVIAQRGRRFDDHEPAPPELFAAFKALLEILLPCGFEYLYRFLLPALELLQRDAELCGICLLCQAEFQTNGFDLRSLSPQLVRDFCNLRCSRKSNFLAFKNLWGRITGNLRIRSGATFNVSAVFDSEIVFKKQKAARMLSKDN